MTYAEKIADTMLTRLDDQTPFDENSMSLWDMTVLAIEQTARDQREECARKLLKELSPMFADVWEERPLPRSAFGMFLDEKTTKLANLILDAEVKP